MEDWIGLIPAAGKGLRLGLPYPKELYPVIRENRYKPVAQFVVENMLAASLQHIVFVINDTKHQLIGFFGDGHRFGCNFSYVVQEPVNRNDKDSSPGLAHALNSAYHLTRGKNVFFGMADTIMQPVDVFARTFQSANHSDDVVFAVFPTDQPHKFGMVRYDEHGKVLEVVDKPVKTNLKEMWGCMIWKPRFTDFLHEFVTVQHIGDFARILNLAIQDGFLMRAIVIPGGNYLDLGTYDEILEMDRRLREGWME
jgi:glucose-1-phosphate thymidylyltransferase